MVSPVLPQADWGVRTKTRVALPVGVSEQRFLHDLWRGDLARNDGNVAYRVCQSAKSCLEAKKDASLDSALVRTYLQTWAALVGNHCAGSDVESVKPIDPCSPGVAFVHPVRASLAEQCIRCSHSTRPALLQICMTTGNTHLIKENVLRATKQWYLDSTTGTACERDACAPLFWQLPDHEMSISTCNQSSLAWTAADPWSELQQESVT